MRRPVRERNDIARVCRYTVGQSAGFSTQVREESERS
jgi:hypothetical protein